MKYLRAWALAVVAGAALTACGGGGDGDQTPRVHYSKVISFGDSLSDVGTYQVSTIAAAGGGEYTVNGTPNANWTQRLALALGLSSPCAAQTGLNSVIPSIPAVAVSNHAECFNYAQGGARVTNPVGPSNLALWTLFNDPSGQLGQLTVPVTTQMDNHLAAHPSFAADELVTVLAGGNDVFIDLAGISSRVQQLVAGGATVSDATTQASTEAVTAMGTAGAELAAYVKLKLLGNGAQRVIVVNLPDVSQTPFALSQSASTQQLINTMVTTFNAQLASGLAGTSANVLQVDAYTQGRAQNAAPAQYGLSNVTTPACDLTLLGQVLFASSLVCSSAGSSTLNIPPTVISGDISHYEFADSVHPTPYGYQLLAQYVVQRMLEAGWL
jgi:phospholipase/lecithinase/hemolysin